MKRIAMICMLLILLVGCSNHSNYTKEIEMLNADIEELKKQNDALTQKNKQLDEQNIELVEKINQLEERSSQLDTSQASLQIADRTSRQIMKNIVNGHFDILENEFMVEFDLNEAQDEILFTRLENNSYFPTNLFGAPMYVAYIASTEAGTDIAYFISYNPNEGDILVNFVYDKLWNLQYISWGH